MKNKVCIGVSFLLYVTIIVSATMYANADEYDELTEIETEYEDYGNIQCEDIYDGLEDEFDLMPTLDEEFTEDQNEYTPEFETEYETEQDTEEYTEQTTNDPESGVAIVGETEEISEPVEANRTAYIGTTININPEEYSDDYCDLELYITLDKYGEGVIESFSCTTDSTYEISNLAPGKYYVAVNVYENSILKLTGITMSDDGILDLENNDSAYVEVTATYERVVPETESETISDSSSEPVYEDTNTYTNDEVATSPETVIDSEPVQQHTCIPLFARILIALIKKFA